MYFNARRAVALVAVAAATFGMSGAAALAAPACITITHTLYIGVRDASTGGDVSTLQAFLGISPTGYFGPITQKDLQAWQAANGIVSSGTPFSTGYGLVGPHTRRVMACGNAASGTTPAAPTTPVTTPPTTPATTPAVTPPTTPPATLPSTTPTTPATTAISIKVTIAGPSASISYANLPYGTAIILANQTDGTHYLLLSPSIASGTTIVLLPASYTAGTYVVEALSSTGSVITASGQFLLNGTASSTTVAPVSNDTLTIASDPTNPASGYLNAAQNGVLVGVVKITAQGSEAITVKQVTLQLTSGKPSDVAELYLYNGSTLVASQKISNTGPQTVSILPAALISANSAISLSINMDIASTLSGATLGDALQIAVVGASGTGGTSGATITSTGSASGAQMTLH